MHRTCVVGPRIAVSAALAFVLLLTQLATSNYGYAKGKTLYAIGATPSPTVTAIGIADQRLATPTVVASPGAATPTPPAVVRPLVATPVVSNPGEATAPVSALQQSSDQISAVSQEVAQAIQDPALSTDAKVQRINSLATQFNQLVAQWQQQLAQYGIPTGAPPAPVCGTECTQQVQPPSVAGVQATPTAASAPHATASLTATPSTNRSSLAGGPTADQLRAMITAVSQQMAQVSQDPSLSAEVRTAQLSTLGAQFNQLMTQLQQLGG